MVTQAMTISDLTATHILYQKWEDEWRFLRAAYQGARSLIAYGVLSRHERESQTNYARRVSEAYGFSYSKSIIDLFNFYLFKEPVKRQLGKLAEDELYAMFTVDCDLHGTDFDVFLIKQGKNSTIEGHVGILVDRANLLGDDGLKSVQTREDEITEKVYPYVASYKPQAILDWLWMRDKYNRPQLSYLKLLEDDGLYRLWWTDKWELWRLPEDDKSTDPKGTANAVLVDDGENPLGEIPFVWLWNEESEDVNIGLSDITDISRIDASIIRNLSQTEEILNYAAFPMMRKPKPERGEPINDEVGVTAVLEFDIEHPESKPDWLDAVTGEPVDAIFKVITKKIEEIYRSSNVGGMSSMETSTQAKSGTALKAEFQLLNSKLVGKGKGIEEAETQIIRYWTMWQDSEDLMEDVTIERAKSYEVENLAQDLENMMTATTIVKSIEFQKKIMKSVARLILYGEQDEVLDLIDKEIDAWEPATLPESLPFGTSADEDE